MTEIWKSIPIEEYKNFYKVSNLGNIYSKHSHKILTPKKSQSGYLKVTLCNRKFQKTFAIHRLVALAFIPNKERKPTVNHINECKNDNRVENLEWATNAEQNVHGTRIERAKAHTDYKARNINYSIVASKHDYSRQDMCNRKATAVYKNKILVGIFNTQKAASKFTGVSRGQISACVNGKKNTCKGYIFCEIEEFPIAVTKIRFEQE